jgi:hypothetical protein
MKRSLYHGFFLFVALLSLCLAQGAENIVPKGFVPAGTMARYGTPDRKLADGSIFDYMDGGGIVYLEHGFRELVHCEFLDPRGRRITFDSFTMETPAQALAALADTRIAPEGGRPLAIAAANFAYRFPPDYFIYLVRDKSLLYLHVDDDALAEILDQFALDILASAKEEKE